MRVAAVQLNSNGEKDRNLAAAERLARALAAYRKIAAQDRVRESLPSLANRRAAYVWAQPAQERS